MEREEFAKVMREVLDSLGFALVAEIVLGIEALQLAGVATNRAFDLGCLIRFICLCSSKLRHLKESIQQLLGNYATEERKSLPHQRLLTSE